MHLCANSATARRRATSRAISWRGATQGMLYGYLAEIPSVDFGPGRGEQLELMNGKAVLAAGLCFYRRDQLRISHIPDLDALVLADHPLLSASAQAWVLHHSATEPALRP